MDEVSVWTTVSTVVLTVTDNGAGIPDHLQPEIFHRFVRGDSSRSRAVGSTGLGLAIVAAVVAAHNGTVSVQSRPGLTSPSSYRAAETPYQQTISRRNGSR